MKLIDQKIALNVFQTSIKNKFTLIWAGIMFPLTLILFLVFALLTQGNVTLLGYNILFTSLLVLTTVLVWDIVNLNFIFSSNQEMGIMNLEVRKGRTAKEIFLTRLLVNKTISILYILLVMTFYLIIFAIFDKRDLSLFWMFLAYLPTDIILTGLFLFIFAFKRYKLTISLSSIILTLILLTPVLQVFGMLIVSKEDIPSKTQVARIYAANEVLNLAHEDNQKTNFTFQLLDDAKYLNELIIDQSEDSEVHRKIEDFSQNLAMKGLFFDSKRILDEMWSDLPDLKKFDKPKDELTINSKTKNSLFFQLNESFSISNNTSISQEDLVNDYVNSLYLNNKVTNKNYQSMIKNLKSLTTEINNRFKNYSGVEKFNNLVIDYAQGMLFNLPKINSPTISGIGYSYTWIEYLTRLTGDTLFCSLNAIDQKELFAHLSISPELRLWNEITAQLIGNALKITPEDMKNVSQKLFTQASALPWTTQYQVWTLANPNINFWDYYRLDNSNFMELGIYWIWNYSAYFNNGSQPELSYDTSNSFETLGEIEETGFTDRPASFKAFSIVGYELAIVGIGVILLALAFVIFIKKFKK